MDLQNEEDLIRPKSYWRWSKRDFYSKPSFQNFKSYKHAFRKNCSRLGDQLLNRSTDSTELVERHRESEIEMDKCLTWWDLIWLIFGSVVGLGIFSITGQEIHEHAGPSIVLSYVISGLSTLLSVFCYTEFAVEISVK